MRHPVITVRRNSSKSLGVQGWKARFTVIPDARMKGRSVEIGLGTRSEYEAVKKAEIIAKAMFVAGFIPRVPPIQVDGKMVSRFAHFEPVAKNIPEQLLLDL